MVDKTFLNSLILVNLFIAYTGLAKVSKGKFYAAETQWSFLDKFCFDKSGGELLIWMKPSVNQSGLKIAFYHDLDHGFPSVYKTDNSCEHKVNKATNSISAHHPHLQSEKGKRYTVHGTRPRWWFVAVANCDEKNVQEISIDHYTIHFTNKNVGPYNHEFSKNEEGIYEASFVVITLLILQAVMVIYWMVYKRQRENARYVPGEYVALFVAMGFDFLSAIFQLVHRGSYSKNGVGYPRLKRFCDFLNIVPEMILLILFIFIAKNWLVSGPSGFFCPPKNNTSWRTAKEILMMFTFANLALIFWGQDHNPAVQEEIYQSTPGVVLVVLRILTMLWFWSSIAATRRKSNDDLFYDWLFFFGLVWFLHAPFIAIIAEFLDDWNRKKVVVIMSYMFDVATYFFFWVLFAKHDSLFSRDSKTLVSTDEFDSGDKLEQNHNI